MSRATRSHNVMQSSRALMCHGQRMFMPATGCTMVDPVCSNASFPADDVPYTFFGTKYVNSNISHQTRTSWMIGRVYRYT